MSQTDFEQRGGMVDDALEYLARAVDKTDEQAAAGRVAELRESYPDATVEELVEMLVKHKATRAGAVGAATSGAAIIPGLGALTSLTLGVAADVAATFKLQAELVLEIAAVYQRTLDPLEKRNAVLLVTGVSAGANQVLSRTGARIAQKTSERLAERAVVKAIPFVGVAASAGVNVLSTYIIGQRAQAYFSLGPESVGDWAASARAISGLDERRLAAWLAEGVEHVRAQAHDAVGATLGASQSAGNLVARGAVAAAGATANLGRRAGAGLASRADRTVEAAVGARRGLARLSRTAAAKTGAAARAVLRRGKRAGEELDAGASGTAEAEGARPGLVERLKSAARAVRRKKEARAEDSVSLAERTAEARQSRAGAVRARLSRARKVFRRGKTEAAQADESQPPGFRKRLRGRHRIHRQDRHGQNG